MLPIPLVNLGQQYQQLQAELEPAMQRVLSSTEFVLSREVEAFEKEFADFCGARYAVGVANGTDALMLALKALGVGAGDEVITVPNTFVATAEAIVHVGAIPVLVDIDPVTYGMDVTKVEACLTPATRAIIPVHLYGQPVDMDPILELAQRRGLLVLEDAAQAHGAKYKERPVGTLGVASGFSFYPGKNLGAYGDAGAIVTNSDAVFETVLKLRNHGAAKQFDHVLIGYNSRLDSLQAAILRVKLAHLEKWNQQRRANASLYNHLLESVPGVVTPKFIEGRTAVFHLYVLQLLEKSRDALRSYLRDVGISTGIHYPVPIHLMPAFRYLGYGEGDFPVAEQVMKRILSLPMYPELVPVQIELIAERICDFVSGGLASKVAGLHRSRPVAQMGCQDF
jgi:dTDP-4-amino-4,6-dideoxygalactose transaminase